MKILFLVLSPAIMAAMIKSYPIDATDEVSEKKEISIGDQVWMLDNLNVDKFRNGDSIPQAKTDEEWENAGINRQPAWCYYDNNPDNGKKYGKLYNWYAVNDSRGLAPKGWHIPSAEDWIVLLDNLSVVSGRLVFGEKMNESSFTNLLGGSRRLFDEKPEDGSTFYLLDEIAHYWSSNGANSYCAYGVSIYPLKYGKPNLIYDLKENGFSIRCLKD
jgi:uncharacterized protein (TIGR02145 family)